MEQLPPDFQKRKELFLKKEGRNLRHLENIYHQRTGGTYISDLVFGANDGIITTFAMSQVVPASIFLHLSFGIFDL